MGINPEVYKQFERGSEYVFVSQRSKQSFVEFFPAEMESITVIHPRVRNNLTRFLYNRGYSETSDWHTITLNGVKYKYAKLYD